MRNAILNCDGFHKSLVYREAQKVNKAMSENVTKDLQRVGELIRRAEAHSTASLVFVLEETLKQVEEKRPIRGRQVGEFSNQRF